MNEETSDFYVYEWYNKENGVVFYVGKGRGRRYKNTTTRNRFFKRYYEKYNCDVRKVAQNLTEKSAYDLEILLIKQYKSIGWCFTNLTDGGESGPSLPGESNPNYGKKHSAETRELISRKLREGGKFKGEKNRQFGISPKDRMDEETYERWRNPHKNLFGEKNWNFGNRKLSEKYREHPELAKVQSRPGVQNGRATPICMYNDRVALEFKYMSLCAYYMQFNEITDAKNIDGIVDKISKAAKTGKEYLGYFFKFLQK